jgi:hypothetical protein
MITLLLHRFFIVPTLRLRVLFVFVVLAHDRRRVLHFYVTEHPTAAWTAPQIVDACPDDSAPSYLLRDRDAVYGHAFCQRVKGMGTGEVLTAPHRPWQRGPSFLRPLDHPTPELQVFTWWTRRPRRCQLPYLRAAL